MSTILTDMVLCSVFDMQNKTNSDFLKRALWKEPNPRASPTLFYPMTRKTIYKRTLIWDCMINHFIIVAFPFLKRIWRPRNETAASKAGDEFVATYKKTLQNRRINGRTINDYRETMLSWIDKLNKPEFKERNITERNLLMQAFFLSFAARNQITSVLVYMFWQIGKNQAIEENIYKEVDEFFCKYNGVIDVEHLQELTYLTACITESFCMFSIFIRLERVCTKDWECGDLRIKRGMVVMIPIWAANQNPKYFQHPEEFDPSRFMPGSKEKINPYAYMTFGHGPRNCIAQKFVHEIMLLLFSQHLPRLQVIQQRRSPVSCYSREFIRWIW